MNKLFDSFRTPLVERIEDAVKLVADRRSTAEYHRYMRDYYNDERGKITPQTSAADACEYARLFTKEEDHEHEHRIAQRKLNDATAKLNALTKTTRA